MNSYCFSCPLKNNINQIKPWENEEHSSIKCQEEWWYLSSPCFDFNRQPKLLKMSEFTPKGESKVNDGVTTWRRLCLREGAFLGRLLSSCVPSPCGGGSCVHIIPVLLYVLWFLWKSNLSTDAGVVQDWLQMVSGLQFTHNTCISEQTWMVTS